MTNVRLLKDLYDCLKKEFMTIEVLSFLTGYTGAYIWQNIRVLKVMGIIDEKVSSERKNKLSFMFNRKFCTFEEFLEFYLQKMSQRDTRKPSRVFSVELSKK